MINASFNSGKTRATAISGAYQYDTGQRLVMHGLPSPEEFSGEDDFLSGDLAVVEVHFSRVGDSQSEMRLGIWDVDRKVWMASVPDEYLSVSEEIQVHVYVSHGYEEEATRGRTMYEGVFTPIARPAPFGLTTPEQEAEWQEKEAEVELAIAACESATENAEAVVDSTNRAAQNAAKPTQEAEEAAVLTEAETEKLETEGKMWQRATFSVTALEPGTRATVDVTRKNDVPHFAFGIPRGADGTPGATGDIGPSDVEFIMDGTTLVINTLTTEDTTE